METTAMETMAETMAAETSVANPTGISMPPALPVILLMAFVLFLALWLYRAFRRKMAGQLYELEKKYRTLRSYDVYAELFLKNARAFQALLGIEHGYRENAGMMHRLRTEYVSLLCQKDLTPSGYAVTVPDIKLDRRAFITRKAGEKPVELKEELREARACVSEWEDRLAYKKAMEGTGGLLYRVAAEAEEPGSRADELRSCIRKISALLCAAGIYPMFYEDFEEASPNRQDFEVGSPYATEYPGFYEKQGQKYCLLEGCWGIRKGETL